MKDLSIYLGGIIVGYIFSILWCKVTKPIVHLARLRGYHLHHTLFIFPLLLVVVFTFGITKIFFLFFGLGILLHHLITEKNLKFISKD